MSHTIGEPAGTATRFRIVDANVIGRKRRFGYPDLTKVEL